MTTRPSVRQRIVFPIAFPSLNQESPFVRTDVELLREIGCDVRVVYNKNLFQLVRASMWADMSFSWFAGLNSYGIMQLMRVQRKPSLVTAGGHDTVVIPEIQYGFGQESWFDGVVTARCRNVILRKASAILAFSKSSHKEILAIGATAPVRTVYCAVDVGRFHIPKKKERVVLSVGALSLQNLERKGHRAFIAVAGILQKKDPSLQFVLIGTNHGSLAALKQLAVLHRARITFITNASNSVVAQWMERAAVYVQPSRHEGFGISVAEAMAAGAIPVVSDKGSLPEVVGKTGFITPYGDDAACARAIRKALLKSQNLSARTAARNHVLHNFSLLHRKKNLFSCIEKEIQ